MTILTIFSLCSYSLGLLIGRYVLGPHHCEEAPAGRTIELYNQTLYWHGLLKLLDEVPASRVVIEDCTVRDMPTEAIQYGADVYLTRRYGVNRGVIQRRNIYIQKADDPAQD